MDHHGFRMMGMDPPEDPEVLEQKRLDWAEDEVLLGSSTRRWSDEEGLWDGKTFNFREGRLKGDRGGRALYEAITEADFDKVLALVEAGADIFYRDPNDNETLLHNAAITGDDNTDIIRLLVDSGCDQEYKNDAGLTPLAMAAKWGKPTNVETLLSLGANVNTVTRAGMTPLKWALQSSFKIDSVDAKDAGVEWARSQGCMEAVKILRRSGAAEHVDPPPADED